MLESHVLHKIQVLVVVPVHLGTGPTCTRATRYVLHSNSASERRPLVVRLFPSSQLKENSVAQVVFPPPPGRRSDCLSAPFVVPY